MATILICEDDLDIVELLKLYLTSNKFDVISASNGLEALEILKNNHVDLLISDIMMPNLNGYELIKKIRETNLYLPIIILSAKTMDIDKVLGFDIGADAYITKPFNPLEVIANINAILRRTNLNNQAKEIVIDNLVLNLEEYTLKKNNILINLTTTEFKILSILMKNPNKIFTKSELYEYLNGSYYEFDDNVMMVHISNIRNKIEDNPKEPKYIKTLRGVGYKFEK